MASACGGRAGSESESESLRGPGCDDPEEEEEERSGELWRNRLRSRELWGNCPRLSAAACVGLGLGMGLGDRVCAGV